MTTGAGSLLPVKDAATVILLKRNLDDPSNSLILMGQRGKNAAFMPSKYVFPGGAVDAGDGNVATINGIHETDRARLLIEPRQGAEICPEDLTGAALRELAEETGLLIGQPTENVDCPWPGYTEAGIQPDASALRYVFRAITPPARPRRFDARFFLIDAENIHGDPDNFSRACDELSHLHWVPISKARALDLPFITEVVLAETADLVTRSGSGPLLRPDSVPFFDNRGEESLLRQIA